MEENEGPRGFKIDFTEEEPEAAPKKQAPAKKESKKPRKSAPRFVRPVFIWLLMLLVIGGAVYAVYHQLHTRLVKLESMSEAEFQGLSGKIDERLTAISELIQEQRNQIRNRVLEVENETQKNAEEIAGIKESLNGIESKLAVLEESFREKTGKLGKIAEQAESDINQQAERLDSLAVRIKETEKLEQKITEAGKNSREAQTRIDKLEKQIDSLQQERTEAEELERRLEEKTEETARSLQQQIESETSSIRSRIGELEDRIQALDAMINTLENMQKESGQQEKGSQESSDSSGKIIEQELK
ncbi:MAG: hypothetical protein ACOCR8_04750 [Desulfosalsimonas sp.]